MKTDVSIHFTIKDQPLDVIEDKINKWFRDGKHVVDFSERTEPRSILHHCFLPREIVIEKGFSEDLVDMLDMISEFQVRWFNTHAYGLVWSRQLMLENLAKLGGTAIFVGEIKEGVKEEYDIAEKLGLDIIHIK